MFESEKIINEIRNVLSNENVKINEPMKNHTSFKVGGPADILVTPQHSDEIVNIIKICKKYNFNYFILGNGSNLIVRDSGFRGVIIKLNKFNKTRVEGERITAGSGFPLANLSRLALSSNLTGLEFACGIPGTIGGAIAMNAGAYNGEVKDVLESVRVIDKEGNMHELIREELELGYRKSALLIHEYIALEAVFKLTTGEHDKIKNRIETLMARRKDKQPLEYPSAGSTFKRPEGHFAAKLIEDSGLKGANIGDAQVSEKHSGFIINKGNATARDILNLIEMVQKIVKEKFDVQLEPEVRIIGEE